MEATNEVKITCSRDGSNTWTVIARNGCETLYVNRFDILKASARERFISQLCEKYPGLCDEAEGIDRELINEAAKEVASRKASENKSDASPLDSMPESVKQSAKSMLSNPELIRIIIDDIAACGVTGEPELSAAVYLLGTSRLLAKPLAGIVQGPTSSGKSFIVDRAATLFPPETVIRAHKMTPEALAHMPEGALVHRFVVAGERSRCQDDKTADATRALREMLSDGHLTKLIAIKRADGQIVTEKIRQPGPIAYVESTTVQGIFDEDRNRCIVFNTDERQKQTKRIIMAMALSKSSTNSESSADDLIQKHHAAQRMLKKVAVRIPFAEALGRVYPSDRTDARRSFRQTLSMIEAVALLHQFQRTDEPNDGTIIDATRDDYEIARRLLAGPMTRSQSGGISDAAMRFYERLADRVSGTFTTTDAVNGDSVVQDVQTVRSYFRALTDAGYLEVVEANRGSKPAVYKLAENPPNEASRCGLPDADELFTVAQVEIA